MSAVLAPSLAGARASEVAAWMRAMRERAEAALERVLPSASHPSRLLEAMRYATLGGGKRVRAMLVYAGGEWAVGQGAGSASTDAASSGLAVADAAACAVELIHAYSLVHDDMPCMDDDALRRGRPTVHVAYDEATALLVGDALQTLAFEVLAAAPDDGGGARRILLLARASGAAGMAGGQAIDLASVGKPLSWPELETMHRAKTGALLRASVLLGATSFRELAAREEAALDRYAAAVGLAFQVVDDILDVVTDSATLGKTAGKDAEQDKPTVVTTLGMDAARAFAARLGDEARDALADLGGATGRLDDLARFVIDRSY